MGEVVQIEQARRALREARQRARARRAPVDLMAAHRRRMAELDARDRATRSHTDETLLMCGYDKEARERYWATEHGKEQ